MKNIIIYSTPSCHYCHMAKDFLDAKGIKYTEFDVASDLKKRKEMIEKTGQMGVPVIDIEGQIMVGYEESRLAEALGIK